VADVLGLGVLRGPLGGLVAVKGFGLLLLLFVSLGLLVLRERVLLRVLAMVGEAKGGDYGDGGLRELDSHDLEKSGRRHTIY
jgi:hypothetical protein